MPCSCRDLDVLLTVVQARDVAFSIVFASACNSLTITAKQHCVILTCTNHCRSNISVADVATWKSLIQNLEPDIWFSNVLPLTCHLCLVGLDLKITQGLH